jgi:hypothetical protein
MNEKGERGEGRIFRRKHSRFLWLQYYRNGAQVRESAGTDNEKKTRNLLRKKLGAVANGIVQDSRSLRYEDIRAAYMDDYVTNAKKSLRRDREGNAYLESVADWMIFCRIPRRGNRRGSDAQIPARAAKFRTF